MATRTSSGVLPVVVVVAALVVFVGPVREMASDVLDDFTSRGTVIVGEGATRFMVAGRGKAEIDRCTAQQVLNDRRCEDRKIVQVDAAKIPLIARNISLAWREGKAAVLEKDVPGRDAVKREAVCGPKVFTKKYPDGSCDEYPFASTVQGGDLNRVRTEEVHKREQWCQGGMLRQEYRRAGIAAGDRFLVIITNPDLIAKAPFDGRDLAKDPSCNV